MNKKFDLKIKRLYAKDKKTIQKIFLGLIGFNILLIILAIATNIFTLKGLAKIITFSLLAIIQIGPIIMVYLLSKKEKTTYDGSFENIYDPIITKFMLDNELKYDDSLIYAELLDLELRGYVEIKKEENNIVYCLKNKEAFKRMETLENINNMQVESYYTEEIPAYESLFVTKVLFAFEGEISLSDIKRKMRDNYYSERMEMCSLVMEKMLGYDLEKRNMVTAENSIEPFSVILLINIIVAVLLFAAMGSWNVLWILAIIFNIAISGMILKQEKVFSYKYVEELDKYIDDLYTHIQYLKNDNGANLKSSDEVLKTLFIK